MRKKFLMPFLTVLGSLALQNLTLATSVLQLSAPTYSVNENGTNVVISVVQVGSATGQVSVDFSTSDGTARAGTNYLATNGTLTFVSGQLSNTFSIPIIDDGVVGPDRTFNVALSNPGGDAILGRASALVTIVESDIGLWLSSASYVVAEANTNLAITILRQGRTNDSVSVNFLTAGGTAVPGVNYVATNIIVAFGAAQTNATVNLRILEDTVAEGDVTVSLCLSNPTSGATLLPPSTATLTIIDNDLHRITTLDDNSLRLALQAGGPTIVACDGVVVLTNDIHLTKNSSLDASGRKFTISGNDSNGILYLEQGGQISVTNVTLANARKRYYAQTGGALYNAGRALFVNCTFQDNHTDDYGSAVFQSAYGSLTLLGCSLINNSSGGAIAGSGLIGPISLTNCTFYGNAGSYGGAVSFQDASYPPRSHNSITVVNCTFSQNGTNTILCLGGTTPLNLLNTVVVGGVGANFNGVVTDLGHNISSDISANFTSPFSLNGIDPGLGPIADNGGPTLTCMLLPESPAIDGGDCSGAPVFDQRGFPRPFGLSCDIGAVEYGSRTPNTLQISSPTRTLSLWYTQAAGQSCRLFVSTNLLDWQAIVTNTIASDGMVTFPPQTNTRPLLFYRTATP